MKSIKNKVLSRIYGRGRGWVFSASDFIEEFSSASIDKSLSVVAKEGTEINKATYYATAFFRSFIG